MSGKVLMLVSAVLLTVLAALFAYEIWFCASALHGAPGGCAAMAGRNLVAEPLRLAAVAMSVAGILVGLRMGKGK